MVNATLTALAFLCTHYSRLSAIDLKHMVVYLIKWKQL